MKMLAPLLFVLILASPLAAQPAPAAVDAGQDATIVAVVNGEAITTERLEALWSSLTPQLAKSYENVGGKTALLDNYIRKRLLLQEAARNGFPDAKGSNTLPLKQESALFTRYVTDHFGPQVISEDLVATFYAEHPDLFRHLDQALVRQIFVSTEKRSPEKAREILGAVMSDLHHQKRVGGSDVAFIEAFAEAAREYSEDTSTASEGGSMGWRERIRLDPALSDAAFAIPPGNMSGLIQSEKGIHLLLVEDRRPAGIESLERAAPVIRQSLIKTNAKKVLEAVDKRTSELMAAAEIEIFIENVR